MKLVEPRPTLTQNGKTNLDYTNTFDEYNKVLHIVMCYFSWRSDMITLGELLELPRQIWF